MQPMPQWPNGFVFYNENDIRVREFLISEISNRLTQSFQKMNPKIKFFRFETPCLVPETLVQKHIDNKFPLWVAFATNETQMALRPESTTSTYQMFDVLFPNNGQLEGNMPICLWQSNLSFRVEQDKTFSNLRFKQFYQLEFQLAYSEGTKADYHENAVTTIHDLLKRMFSHQVRIDRLSDADKPFYSAKTTDIYLEDWECVAISNRTDFRHPVLEISCGLDRLTAVFNGDVD